MKFENIFWETQGCESQEILRTSGLYRIKIHVNSMSALYCKRCIYVGTLQSCHLPTERTVSTKKARKHARNICWKQWPYLSTNLLPIASRNIDSVLIILNVCPCKAYFFIYDLLLRYSYNTWEVTNCSNNQFTTVSLWLFMYVRVKHLKVSAVKIKYYIKNTAAADVGFTIVGVWSICVLFSILHVEIE